MGGGRGLRSNNISKQLVISCPLMGVFRYVFQILDSFETISHLGINHKIPTWVKCVYTFVFKWGIYYVSESLHLLFHLVNKVIS